MFSPMIAQPENEAAYVGKPPGFFLGAIFGRFYIVHAAIIVIVRVAGSNGFRIIPRSLEPAAIGFVSFFFPAFRVQYEQLATLADESVQGQYLAIIFFTLVVGFGVMILSVAKYAKVWRRLASPGPAYLVLVPVLPVFYWSLTHEKFKPAMDTLTALFFDSRFGWFYIRQVALVITAQLLVTIAVVAIAQIILMRTKPTKHGG